LGESVDIVAKHLLEAMSKKTEDKQYSRNGIDIKSSEGVIVVTIFSCNAE